MEGHLGLRDRRACREATVVVFEASVMNHEGIRKHDAHEEEHSSDLRECREAAVVVFEASVITTKAFAGTKHTKKNTLQMTNKEIVFVIFVSVAKRPSWFSKRRP